MLSLHLGVIGFLLYLLYDINSFTRRSRSLHSFFMLGTILIGAAGLMDLYAAWQLGAFSGALDMLLAVLGALCFVLLMYCLFFALPFEETYTEQRTDRQVYDKGVYALCRHPGILCFWAMFLFLGSAALPGKLLRNGMVFSLLNLAYAWFQDRLTFPRTFCDYETYRKKVPFLIPNRDSIRLAQQTWISSVSKEDKT
ncbi:MAG: hypothetical protein IJ042_04815 [Butyricicoccus sp.]|nr:hypothetical protein [Butyricicoccus sp.]